MGKFDQYKIVLKTLGIGSFSFEYKLDSEYFKKIDSPEVERGKVDAKAVIKNNGSEYEIQFQLDGVVMVPCDRCLDDMELPISQKSRLIVKLGMDYSEESDEIIVIPEEEGIINLAWFLYEFIALSIPVKHVHAPGKCNKYMTTKLKKHMVKSPDGDQDDIEEEMEETEESFIEPGNEQTDPRWEELNSIIDNN